MKSSLLKTYPYLLLTAIILFLPLQACQNNNTHQNESAKNCTAIQKGIEEIQPQLDDFKASAAKLAQLTENDLAFDQELRNFTTKLTNILLKTDTLFATHQKPCKAYYAHKNLPDEVIERVYRPFIQIHAHLILTMRNLSKELKNAPNSTLMRPIILIIDDTAHELESQLRAQNKVCIMDFNESVAAQYDSILNDIIAPAQLKDPNNSSDEQQNKVEEDQSENKESEQNTAPENNNLNENQEQS